MIDPVFLSRLREIRESIFQGNVSDGVTALSTLLMETFADDERIEVLLDLVLLSVSCGDFDEARRHWEEVCACRGDEGNLLRSAEVDARETWYAAFFQTVSNSRKKGLALFEKCIMAFPDNFELYLLRGIAYMTVEQYEHAQADLDRANTLSPNNVIIMSIMADVCVELGEEERAISLHEAVLSACPDFRRSLMSLGVLYYDRHRIDEAFRLFQCLVAYDPMNWFAWGCLGDIRMMQPGRTFQALPYYSASIVSGTEVGQTYLNLVRGLYLIGRYREGLLVLASFERASGHRLNGEEHASVRYLKLMGEIIVNDQMKHDSNLLKRLGARHDEATSILFQILYSISTITCRNHIHEVFGSHLVAFILLANYLQQCDGRMIEQDETVLLCVLAHMMIWNGFLFEARAIIGLLSKSDEPRVMDAIGLLWNEIHEHGQAEDAVGIHIERIHSKFIDMPGADRFLDMVFSGRGGQVVDGELCRDIMAQEFANKTPYEFSCQLFQAKFGDVFEDLYHVPAMDDGDNADMIGRFWHACSVVGSGVVPVEEVADRYGIHGRVRATLYEFSKLYLNHDEAHKSSVTDDVWISQCLKYLSNREFNPSKDFPFVAANDDVLRVCAATPEEALSGFEALPFALDGTAFMRLVPGADEGVSRLSADTVEDFLETWIRRFLLYWGDGDKRCSQNDRGVDLKKRLALFLKMLHGQTECTSEPVKGETKFLSPALYDLSHKDSAAMYLCNAMSSGVLEGMEFRMPEVSGTDFGVRYRVQKVPAYPRAAEALGCPVPENLLTYVDIVEQFFNRGVYAIELWQKTGESRHLEIFLSEPKVFRFVSGAVKKSSTSTESRNRIHRIRRKSLMTVMPLSMSASNTDNERRVAISANKLRKHYRDHGMAEIFSTAEMADALTQSFEAAHSHPKLLMDDTFSEGTADDPFLRQIKSWAEAHARHILPEMMKIQSEVLSIGTNGPYMVSWKIHDMLKRYPFLSRLYVLLAGIYAYQGNEDKAVQTIQAGLVWENRLYSNVGWIPQCPNDQGEENGFEIVETPTELEENRNLLWTERYVFLNHEESMYHYGGLNSGSALRRRHVVSRPLSVQRIVVNDKGGCFDFYRLMRRFIQAEPRVREVYLSALHKPSVYSLRDYLVHVVTNLVAPEMFPLRRQMAELLYHLYPCEDTGAFGRFYCDNLQSANALPYAAYAYFMHGDDVQKDVSQAALTLGCLLYDMGYMEESMKYLDRAVQGNSPSPMAFLTRGCALIEMHDFRKAIECLKQGMSIDPTSDRFPYNLSLAYVELNMLDEAEQMVKQGIALSRYPVDLNMQLMRIYVRKGRFVEALPLAQYVAKEDPDMLLTALKFSEFSEFVKLQAVKNIMDECSYNDNR